MSEIKSSYYDNGQLKHEEIHYENQQYVSRYWYDNGQPSYEIPYYQDKWHGIVKYWLKDGRTASEVYYLYNKIVTEEEYRKYELIITLSGI